MSVITGDDEDDVTQRTNAVIAAVVGCARRDDGKKTHVFLGHDNRCQCGDKDLNAYRNMVLQ